MKIIDKRGHLKLFEENPVKFERKFSQGARTKFPQRVVQLEGVDSIEELLPRSGGAAAGNWEPLRHRGETFFSADLADGWKFVVEVHDGGYEVSIEVSDYHKESSKRRR